MPKYKNDSVDRRGEKVDEQSSSSRPKPISSERYRAIPPPESLAAAIRAGQEEAPPPEKLEDPGFELFDRRKGENRNPKLV